MAEVSSRTEERRVEVRDTVRETVLVAVHDTVTITNTITITENEHGDTIKLVQLTERDRVRDRTGFKVQDSRVTVKTDTVSVERDSVNVEDKKIGLSASADGGGSQKRAGFLTYVKWIFALICAVIVLILTIRIGMRRSLL